MTIRFFVVVVVFVCFSFRAVPSKMLEEKKRTLPIHNNENSFRK